MQCSTLPTLKHPFGPCSPTFYLSLLLHLAILFLHHWATLRPRRNNASILFLVCTCACLSLHTCSFTQDTDIAVYVLLCGILSGSTSGGSLPSLLMPRTVLWFCTNTWKPDPAHYTTMKSPPTHLGFDWLIPGLLPVWQQSRALPDDGLTGRAGRGGGVCNWETHRGEDYFWQVIHPTLVNIKRGWRPRMEHLHLASGARHRPVILSFCRTASMNTSPLSQTHATT